MSTNVWVTVLAALFGGGLVQAIASYATRNKTDAEATDLISHAAERIVGRLEAEIIGLREQITLQMQQIAQQNIEIANQNKEIQNLRREINILRAEIERHGGNPDDLVGRIQ